MKFLARAPGYQVLLTGAEAVLVLPAAGTDWEQPEPIVVRVGLEGGNPASAAASLQELPGKVNYFVGSDPREWRTNIPTYAEIAYHDLYPGIDLVYHGDQRL